MKTTFTLLAVILSTSITLVGQSLIGMKKDYIDKDMKSMGGKFEKEITEQFSKQIWKNVLSYSYTSPVPLEETYFFDSLNVATEVMYNVYEPDRMMSDIKDYNEKYIKTGEFSWIMYQRNQKLSVSLTPREDGNYIVVFELLSKSK